MPMKPPIHRLPAHHAALDAARRRYDRQRGTPTQRGYGRRWMKAAKAYLNEHPLCVVCQREGHIAPAALVDHVVPHQGDERLFWNESNWQALCRRCHSTKTVTCDGGFGNARRMTKVNAGM